MSILQKLQTMIAAETTDEIVLARPFPARKYTWFIYNHKTPHHIISTSKKFDVEIYQGHRIGFRDATTAPNKIRVIHEKTGRNRVFTLSKAKAKALQAKCVACRTPTNVRKR